MNIKSFKEFSNETTTSDKWVAYNILNPEKLVYGYKQGGFDTKREARHSIPEGDEDYKVVTITEYKKLIKVTEPKN